MTGQMSSVSGSRSRLIEDGAAVVGVLIGAAYVVFVEIARVCSAPPGIPWGVVIIVGACVLPKTIGRVTAGKIWEKFSGRGGQS